MPSVMRTSRTRIPRAAASGRSRPARARSRAAVRRQPPRRAPGRRPYAPRRSGLGLTTGRSLKRPGLAVAAVAALALAVALLADGSHLLNAFHVHTRASAVPAGSLSPVADQVVYTARTANDTAVTLPEMVQQRLTADGQAHQSVALTEVGYTGDVSSSYIDMTPRTGNSAQDPVLKVTARATSAIDAKISGIETAVNSPGGGNGGRALYLGLTRIDFTGAPVTIVSSGLDLSDPDNFRSLNWSVPPAEISAQVEKSGDVPALHGPVTFVLVPAAGAQPQLSQSQQDYLKEVWTALLKAAGATSVTFIDAEAISTTATAPGAPTVGIPSQPVTPIAQVHAGPGKVTCTVPDSLFVYDTARLVGTTTTVQELTACIKAALAAHATFRLDGYASYEGPLNAQGRPETNDPRNVQLSGERVRTIAKLLVDELEVPRSAITGMTGHGNSDQPDPNPRSAANRVVVITYTVHD
ncbi:MAG: hypothetical protein ACLPKE_03710 [Streptosporangiaceae bacterium]